MPSKVIAAVAAAGAASAVLMLLSSVSAAPFAGFAQLPLFVVGLSFGWPAAALAGGVGSVGMAALGGLSLAATFAAILAAPVAILCQRALRHRTTPDGAVEWYSPGRLAGDATILALLVACGHALMLASLGTEGQALLRGRLDTGGAPLTPEDEALRDVLRAVAPVLPGFAGGQWLWMVALNGAMGQWLARRAGAAWRPSPRMAD